MALKADGPEKNDQKLPNVSSETALNKATPEPPAAAAAAACSKEPPENAAAAAAGGSCLLAADLAADYWPPAACLLAACLLAAESWLSPACLLAAGYWLLPLLCCYHCRCSAAATAAATLESFPRPVVVFVVVHNLSSLTRSPLLSAGVGGYLLYYILIKGSLKV